MYIRWLLWFVAFKYCSCLILLIKNPNVPQHKLIGQPIFTEFIRRGDEDVAYENILSICFTVDGRICDCFYPDASGALNTVLTAACVRSEAGGSRDGSYWFGAIASTHPSTAYRSEIASLPVRVSRSFSSLVVEDSRDTDGLLTLVLPLTVPDFARSTILFESLVRVGHDRVLEMLVFVPDAQLAELRALFDAGLVYAGNHSRIPLPFPLRLIGESALFGADDPGTYPAMVGSGAVPYGVQMAVKLLAARAVRTAHYLTLDADCVLLQPWHKSQLFVEFQVRAGDGLRRLPLAVYDFESRVHGHHPDWWDSTDEFLRLPGVARQSPSEREQQGFSVTPALLSTYGSLLTAELVLRQVRERHCGATVAACNPLLQWLLGFGRSARWTEYTLYAIVLDYYQLFANLHVSQQSLHARGPGWERSIAKLHCFDLWYSPTLEFYSSNRDNIWLQLLYSDVSFVDEATGAELSVPVKGADNLGTCLFSVIQSHAQLPVDVVQDWVRQIFS
jgi:hypothetical protein